jgi:hypothetical protein
MHQARMRSTRLIVSRLRLTRAVDPARSAFRRFIDIGVGSNNLDAGKKENFRLISVRSDTTIRRNPRFKQNELTHRSISGRSRMIALHWQRILRAWRAAVNALSTCSAQRIFICAGANDVAIFERFLLIIRA